MKISDIEISNFRGLKAAQLNNLTNGIVIAGPNGCGKSCVLEAIRGLKSAYGSYDQDEWTKWCQEFGIDLNGTGNVYASIFFDKYQPVTIKVVFQLSQSEKDYMRDNLKGLLRNSVWSQNQQPYAMAQPRRRVSLAENLRNNQDQLEQRYALLKPVIDEHLQKGSSVGGEITILPTGAVHIAENHLLEFIFATYDAQHLGIIDYYSANRRYNRSGQSPFNIPSSNIDLARRQSALYGPEKASTLRNEMGSSFISKLLSTAASPEFPQSPDDPLTVSLKELFSNFFPGKQFLGPTPTAEGKLTFPVRLASGAVHDIDELSSGEKEIVYGYLRIYSEKHKNSVIVIDEPELHLNPRLTSGLVAFYYKHLAAENDNQIFLVTHSDAIIRDAISHPSFQVYHFQPAQTSTGPQATLVTANNQTDRLIYDLVGDMAAYRPGATIVILESTKDIAFDRRILERLFPEFSQQVNYLSAGNRDDVRRAHTILKAAQEEGFIHASIYAIGDRDSEQGSFSGKNRYVWDVYHIENYLLSARHILKTLKDSNAKSGLETEAQIWNALKTCARDCIPELAAHLVREELVRRLEKHTRLALNNADIVDPIAVLNGVGAVRQNVDNALVGNLSPSEIQLLISTTINQLNESLDDNSWATKIPGRKILSRFAIEYCPPGLAYAGFVEWIVTNMVNDGYRPVGMAEVLTQIRA